MSSDSLNSSIESGLPLDDEGCGSEGECSSHDLEGGEEAPILRLHKSTLGRTFNRDMIPTDLLLARYPINLTTQREAHLNNQRLARTSRSATLADEVADGLDYYSIVYPREVWGFNLDEVLWALTMTKQTKATSEKQPRILVRQSQITRDPLVAWGVPSCVFYPQVADVSIDDRGLDIPLGEDMGIEYDDDDMNERPSDSRRKKNSELPTANIQRMRRLRQAAIKQRCLPLHFLPLFLSKQSSVLMKVNNPMIVCFRLEEALKRQLPFHQSDPTYMAAVVQFQKNLYFVCHQTTVHASATTDLAMKLVDMEGYLRKTEQIMLSLERRDTMFGKLLEEYSAALGAPNNLPSLKRKRGQIRARANKEEKIARIDKNKIPPDFEEIKTLVSAYGARAADERKARIEQELGSEDEDEATRETKKRKIAPPRGARGTRTPSVLTPALEMSSHSDDDEREGKKEEKIIPPTLIKNPGGKRRRAAPSNPRGAKGANVPSVLTPVLEMSDCELEENM